MRKTVIVTGATGGIGHAIVRTLYSQGGFHIVATGRRMTKLLHLVDEIRTEYQSADSVIDTVEMDLSSVLSVRHAALSLKSCRIDCIINNAGQMPLRSTYITSDGFEQTLQVNCLSTLLFTRLLTDSVNPGGNIVFTTSVTRSLPRVRTDFVELARDAASPLMRFVNYGRSKQLLALYAQYMHARLQSRGIAVNCADPGVVDSGIISLGYPIVDWLADRCFRPFISSPSVGAGAAIAAMNAKGGDSLIYRHDGTTVAFDPRGPVQATVRRLESVVDGLLI
ncbi:MAG: SDR family NAD(P)-dependent oxidoreductase [Muribaculaceae bacterium]|nr:SDR family NAD(P)-dependent oxidoreductase [Muribaculaceae bacterium]